MTFTDVLDQLNVPYKKGNEHHHVRTDWIGIDCPYCSPGWSHFRLGYNLRSGYMTCWSCGPKRTVNALAQASGRSEGYVAAMLKGVARDILPPEFKVQGTYKEPEGLGPFKAQHKNYLKKRGLDLGKLKSLWHVDSGTCRQFKLGWRIFIPVLYRGERVSWTTRSLADTGLRYITAPPDRERYPAKDLLYGEDYVRSTVIVCEGPIDVWKIGPGAVCTFGTSFTWAQFNRIAKYPTRYVCFDAQPDAQVQARALVERLSLMPGETYNVVLEDGKDPGSTSDRELQQLQRLVAI